MKTKLFFLCSLVLCFTVACSEDYSVPGGEGGLGGDGPASGGTTASGSTSSTGGSGAVGGTADGGATASGGAGTGGTLPTTPDIVTVEGVECTPFVSSICMAAYDFPDRTRPYGCNNDVLVTTPVSDMPNCLPVAPLYGVPATAPSAYWCCH